MARIAIVGAGLAGLVLARRLAPKHTVTVYEKSRGPGGRMATRYAGDFEFDHGAQFFTAKSQGFRRFLEPLIRDGVVAPWPARFVRIEDGRVAARARWGDTEPRYVGVPRMNAVGKRLAEGLDVRYGSRVEYVERAGPGWRLTVATSPEPIAADWLLVTAPLAQARVLLEDVALIAAAIGDRAMPGCYALMLGLATAPALGFDAAEVRGADIAWIAENSSKPGRDAAPSLVVHSTNRWAEANMDRDLDEVRHHLLEELARVTGGRVGADAVHQAVHRWRFAKARDAGGESHFLSADARLGVAGDGWTGGRVESAFASADALADRLATLLG